MRDIIHNIAVRTAVVPAVQAASANGSGIDTLGFNSLVFAINTGAIASAGDFGVKLQDSDDDTTYADVAAAQVQGTVPATLVASTSYKLGYVGFKRYARLAITKAGGTSIALGASAILGHPASAPVA